MHAGLFYVSSLGLIATLLVIVGAWKTFEKAGQPGWAVLVPIYNFIVSLRIAGRPVWWVLLLLIPIVNVVIAVIVNIDVAKRFGKDALFGVGMTLLPVIFIPILGLGGSRYLPAPGA